MNNPIGWFEIYVDDMERAKAFYQAIFDVKLEKMNDPTESDTELWGFPSSFESYGATGALVKMAGYSAGGNSTIVYFSCDDCANEESRVKQAGGKVEQAKMSIGEYGFCSLVADTEGNIIGLHSQT